MILMIYVCFFIYMLNYMFDFCLIMCLFEYSNLDYIDSFYPVFIDLWSLFWIIDGEVITHWAPTKGSILQAAVSLPQEF
jgi:hypothetical protein